MKPRKSPATDEELVNVFVDLFNQVEPETNDEIDAVLRQAGYDPEAVAIRISQIANQSIPKEPEMKKVAQLVEAENWDELENLVFAACKTSDDDGLNEWLAAGDYHGYETIKSLAAEWDEVCSYGAANLE